MKRLVVAAFAAALVSATAVYADDHHDTDHHDSDHHDTMGGPARHDDHMGGAMMGGPMAGHVRHHGWHHGDRLPNDYWHASEVDWHRYHLRRPPHGYHWVRVDDDYVLVALTTGIILETALADH